MRWTTRLLPAASCKLSFMTAAQRVRLLSTCALPRNTALLSPLPSHLHRTVQNAQRRIHRTTALGTTTRSSCHRSPHQWSHIVHHSRKPTALSASPAAMATNSLKPPQARPHMGHSHSHHHHDNTFLTSANKNDPGVRITRIGLYVNLGMAIAKGAGGYIFNSQA